MRAERGEAASESAEHGVGFALGGQCDRDGSGVFGVRTADVAAQQTRHRADAEAREHRSRRLLGRRRGDALEVCFEPALGLGLARLGVGDVERASADEKAAVTLEGVFGEGVAHEIVRREPCGVELRRCTERLILGRCRTLLRAHADVEQRRRSHGASLSRLRRCPRGRCHVARYLISAGTDVSRRIYRALAQCGQNGRYDNRGR